MKNFLLVLAALLLALPCRADDPTPTPTPTPKPKLKVAADGFPAGHATPEGVACDLARAFITTDAALFTTTCLPAYGDQPLQDSYKEFLHGVIESLLKLRALKLDTDPYNPKAIAKVFAARHLSREGLVSRSHEAFGFLDVAFVDVDALLKDGEHAVNRTLVVKNKDGQWYAHPMPELSPVLGDGLDDESPSTRDFSDVYELER